MRIHLFTKRRPVIILAVAIPVIFWSLSEILPIMASGLNRKGYQSAKKNPSEASSTLIIRNKDSIDRKFIKDIKFPLSRKSDLRFDHERFDLRIIGLLEVEKSGFFWIGTESDDGSWIWIDGKKILDNGGLHPRVLKMNFVPLEKGLHSIELKFENQMGDAYLDPFWILPTGARQPLPFFPHPFGGIVSYLLWSAHIAFKIAQYWFFLMVPLLLFKVLFPTEPNNGDISKFRERGKPGC
jgi:hypothetical protein